MSFTDGLQEFLLAVRCTLKNGIDGADKKRYESAQAILNKYGFTHYKDREAVWTKTINQSNQSIRCCVSGLRFRECGSHQRRKTSAQ